MTDTASSAIPYVAGSVITLDPETWAQMQRAVRLIHAIGHSDGYALEVDEGAPEVAAFEPGNEGVLMGYDFHLTQAGPRLIEINTNAGGALLNGLHTHSLCRSECGESGDLAEMERRIVQTFQQELQAAAPAGSRLRRVAIVDECPREQFLYPEFELFIALFERAGIEASVVDTAALDPDAFDLIYWRDTDFQLAEPRSRRVRQGYLARRTVVSPSPREHHLLAHKGRLALFSSRTALEELAVPAGEIDFLCDVVPETRRMMDLDPDCLWAERQSWVFKPVDLFGGKAVYRGDKISRARFGQIADGPAFLAQRRVEPGSLTVDTDEGQLEMKFDVRAYAYRDEVLLAGARVYRGQVTNLRTAGGGFSAICVAP